MKTIISILFFAFTLFLISSCGDKPVQAVEGLEGYAVESVAGGIAQKASMYSEEGNLIEEGFITQGLKSGTWLKYEQNDGRIELLTSFANGLKNGVQIKFSRRGQMEKKSYYKDDILHGKVIQYSFGRPLKEHNYANGELDGIQIEYHQNGKKQREIEYKNGVLDGIYKYYDDAGNMTLEYLYKDGEKVSGGIVEDE